MAEQTDTHDQDNEFQLILQKVYVKDASFEAPNAPQIFHDIAETANPPEVSLNMSQKATELDPATREVVLTLTLTCNLEERTAYLAEVHQAGIFTISGFSEDEQASILGSYCPNVLFPYARQVISAMIQDGGFPPFLLQPINFDALFAEQQRRQATGETAPTLNS